MRGKACSKVRGMEVTERPLKSKEEAHLSGAYIRSLVKHLSSWRPKEPVTHPKSPNSTLEDRLDEGQPAPLPPPPLPQPKKQVRRRLHTSRPFQERLLNMAEARREIVTALKFHRAAMKQANEHQQQPQSKLPPPPPPPPLPLEGSNRNSNLSIYQQNDVAFSDLSVPSFTYPSPLWPYPTIAPLPNIHDNLSLPLPNQPLGLNLSFQGFNNIDTPLYYDNNNNNNNNNNPPSQPPSPLTSSCSSHSYSSPPTMMGDATETQTVVALGGSKDGKLHLHLEMGEEDMAEMRLIGEKHDIEWNDTMNLVTSAWWSQFLEKMEVDPMMMIDDRGGFNAFDEPSSIPAWLKDDGFVGAAANPSHFLMHHADDYYLQNASLPCLDIGEIEGYDGEWLS